MEELCNSFVLSNDLLPITFQACFNCVNYDDLFQSCMTIILANCNMITIKI